MNALTRTGLRGLAGGFGGTSAPRGRTLVIGLLNNMPDSALRTTERQFAGLLHQAGDGVDIELRCYTLPDIERADPTRRTLAETYRPLRSLRDDPPHALIVSGAEPIAKHLPDEPYWQSLTAIFDWAQAQGIGLMLSCLAAHAAVLHAHGVERQRRGGKCSGVFAQSVRMPHPIMHNTQAPLCTPQSRWNDLPETALARAGYQVLTASPEAGVDIFVHPDRDGTIFLNGHPEYDADTLAREYRRDVGRFLRGEAATYPDLPHAYFDRATEQRLLAFRSFAEAAGAEAGATDGLLRAFPDIEQPSHAPWRGLAGAVFRNWIAHAHASAARP